MADTKTQLIETISNMTVLELSSLVKDLEEKLGVSAAPPVESAPGDATAAVEEEKTEFDVILIGMGEKKINVIKEVRALTTLGLKEAKELVESAGPDCKVKEAVSKEEAEEVVKKLKDAGAAAEVK